MSWLRSSPLRQSLTRSSSSNNNSASHFFSSSSGASGNGSSSGLRQRPIDSATDCDPRACYDSFCKHWQQAFEIIQRSEPPQKPPTHDDVLGVVSHLDFMVTLLLVELHHCNKISLPPPPPPSTQAAAATTSAAAAADGTPPAPCLEFMLSENLLDKLYEWGCTTGRYANAVRLEQLKLYELLVSHSRHQLLCHEPFLRPLLKILASSQGEIFPPDLEKRLVILLNQLCVVLMQNVHLLDLFFFSAQAQAQEQPRQIGASTNFIIFSLLIPYVHREGSIGHQARDALLLCMALSQKNSNIGTYIAQYSSMCPLLVTGLGGLYSRLPNSIEITSIDWYRITPDDVTEIPELTLFMNALEFCNAVVQVAHEMIKHQLLDFMYQGFIVPVLGPAVLQTLKGKHFQTNIDSQISAMSYLDLILRSVTEPGLLRAFVRFLLDTDKFDGERILDVLVDRLSSTDPNLCMITMALFDTLLALHCEDLMLELLLKYMLPGKHVPISYRHKINKIDPYTNTAEFFLDLTPDVMKRARDLTKHKFLGDTVSSNSNNNNSSSNSNAQQLSLMPPPLPSPISTMSKTIGANWNYYSLHTAGDSLYSNFHAYLFEAHYRIAVCQRAMLTHWTNSYRYQKPKILPKAHTLDMVRQFFSEFSTSPLQASASPLLTLYSSGATTAAEQESVNGGAAGGEKKQYDSLQSIGESSGYESFKWRPADEDAADQSSDSQAQHSSSNVGDADLDNSNGSSSSSSKQSKNESWRVSSVRSDLILTDLDFSEDLFTQGTVSLGPFLNAIWGKLQTFTSNTLYVNLHLTGLITRLAWYPIPLIHSILLRPDIVITSDTPSFHQVLRILKQQIDAELPVLEDSLEIIDVARSHLIDREFRLINARKAGDNSPLHVATTTTSGGTSRLGAGSHQTTYAQISASSPVQVTPSSSYDPFKRNDTKRKSISKSITSMFSRNKPNSTNNNNSSSSSNGSNSSPFASSAAPSQSAAATDTVAHTRETSLTTLPAASGDQRRQTTTNEQRTLQQLQAATQTSAASASASAQALHSGQASFSASNSSFSSAANALTSNTLLGGGSSGVGGGGANNSEPASLDSLSSMGAIANTSGTERTRDLALCAVLLDEWLKELAAIAQEQSVVLLNDVAAV